MITKEELYEHLALVLDVNLITDSSDIDSIPGWDSIAHVNIFASLEEELGVEFTDEEIVMGISAEIIYELLQSKAL